MNLGRAFMRFNDVGGRIVDKVVYPLISVGRGETHDRMTWATSKSLYALFFCTGIGVTWAGYTSYIFLAKQPGFSLNIRGAKPGMYGIHETPEEGANFGLVPKYTAGRRVERRKKQLAEQEAAEKAIKL
eukprot:228124_1